MNFIIILMLYFFHQCCGNDNLTTYLRDQSRMVNQKILKEAKKQDNIIYDFKIEHTERTELASNYSNGHFLTLFNKTYVLVDQDLYAISLDGNNLQHTFLPKEKIQFVKSTEFNSLGLLLIAGKSGILYVYGVDKNAPQKYFKLQNIHNTHVSDAAFFENGQNLYLVVSSNKGDNFAPMTIYKFAETHFDEIETILTIGETKVHTFSDNESEFIVVLQYLSTRKITSSLYEFKAERMRKIQKIETDGPQEIFSYTYKNMRHVLIFDKNDRVAVFLWSGSELLFWDQLTIARLYQHKIVSTTTTTIPLLIADQNETLAMFSLLNNRVEPIQGASIRTNLTKILALHLNARKPEMLVLGLNDQNRFCVDTISFQINGPDTGDAVDNAHHLPTCFHKLEETLYKLRRKIDETPSLVGSNQIVLSVDANFDQLSARFDEMRPKLDQYQIVPNTLVINGTTTVRSPVEANKLSAKALHITKLNNHTWAPEQWMSYSKPQKVPGLVTIKIVHVGAFETSPNEAIFKGALLGNASKQTVGKVNVDNLKVVNIETDGINNIPMGNIYLASKPVTIMGLKRFNTLKANNIKMGDVNGVKGSDATARLADPQSQSKLNFGETLLVDNLIVEKINDIDFDSFRRSVFRAGSGEPIDGNLVFDSIGVSKVTVETLGGRRDYLTTSTDQNVTSSIFIGKIFTNDIKTERTNSIKDFGKSVATYGSKILGPVQIDRIVVSNDLEMVGKLDELQLEKDGVHIMGTNETDFLQIYTGNVKIQGDLYLKNLKVDPSSKIVVSGRIIDLTLDQYWTKTTRQVIPIHFEALNGISTPHVFTKIINNINIADFMLNSTTGQKSTKFYFENIKIKGDINLNSKHPHSPDLHKIQEESVKLNGTFEIKGRRIYKNPLKIETLDANQVDGIDIGRIIRFNLGTNQIENLVVNGNLICKNTTVDILNNVTLSQLKEDALYIDTDQDVAELNFQNVSVKKILIEKLNNRDFMTDISKFKQMEAIDALNKVRVNGDVKIKKCQNVSTINNFKVNQLFENSTTQYKDGFVLGDVRFLGTVTTKHLDVTVINDVDFSEISPRFLYKQWAQNMTTHFTFRNLKTVDLITPKINDMDLKLIDVSSTVPQNVSGSLRISKSSKVKNLAGNLPCDLDKALQLMRNPRSQAWNTLEIAGNVTFWDKACKVSQIFQNGVTNLTNHIITAPITFSRHISAKNVTAFKNINNIKLLEILDDALLNDQESEQIVTGKFAFSKMHADEVVSLQNIAVDKINNFNLTEIDEKIIRRTSNDTSTIMRGKKVLFGGLQAKNLQTKLVSGVKPETLVTFDKPGRIPHAVFDSINVTGNFNMRFLNNMPFDEILGARLLRTSKKQNTSATYFFQNVGVAGEMSAKAINDVVLNNVVYDAGVQIIDSTKKFTADVTVNGEVTSDLINGIRLSETYEKALLNNEETHLSGNAIFLEPTEVRGNIKTDFINGVPIGAMVDTVNAKSLQTEANRINQISKTIGGFVTRNLERVKRIPTEFMYLERSTNLQIPIPNTVSAQVVETKQSLLIHVGAEEPGSYCGLPEDCRCPVQYTVQITPEHSVSSFLNKGTQRIYSYYDDDVSVNFISNSISTNSHCRTNMTKIINEVSTLSWNTPTGNTTGNFYMHQEFFQGYISGVQYFTIYGVTYVVVGKYYDPVLDSHNLGCNVMKFNKDKTQLVEIQTIPTQGMWTLSLVYTAQGVVLIMGNTNSEPQSENINTQIYRFNIATDQFELLRTVPSFGSLAAVGVVLDKSSLIVLANKHSTLHILNYDPKYNNYYFYQSFQLDYPIYAMSVFYSGDFGISDAYLSVVTENSKYFIYSFRFIEGWRLESVGELEGIKGLIPFKLNKESYLYAPSSKISSLLTFVEHDLE